MIYSTISLIAIQHGIQHKFCCMHPRLTLLQILQIPYYKTEHDPCYKIYREAQKLNPGLSLKKRQRNLIPVRLKEGSKYNNLKDIISPDEITFTVNPKTDTSFELLYKIPPLFIFDIQKKALNNLIYILLENYIPYISGLQYLPRETHIKFSQTPKFYCVSAPDEFILSKTPIRIDIRSHNKLVWIDSISVLENITIETELGVKIFVGSNFKKFTKTQLNAFHKTNLLITPAMKRNKQLLCFEPKNLVNNITNLSMVGEIFSNVIEKMIIRYDCYIRDLFISKLILEGMYWSTINDSSDNFPTAKIDEKSAHHVFSSVIIDKLYLEASNASCHFNNVLINCVKKYLASSKLSGTIYINRSACSCNVEEGIDTGCCNAYELADHTPSLKVKTVDNIGEFLTLKEMAHKHEYKKAAQEETQENGLTTIA
jgi:hypothetical protein